MNISGGLIYIQGVPPFAPANVSTTGCFGECPQACVPQVVTVTPTIPSATCECPWGWQLTIEKLPCIDTFRVTETFAQFQYYDYQDPNGATPTVNAIITSIVLQVNSNPSSIVTATPVGSPGSYTAFTLTEKDCDTDNRTCGFNAFIASGTIAVTGGSNAAHQRAVLSAAELAREFPITPGQFLMKPETAFCGSYCKFSFTIDPIARSNDPHLAWAKVDRTVRYEIYVNSSLANFETDFYDVLTGVGGIACLEVEALEAGAGTFSYTFVPC